MKKKPVILVILDGFGLREETHGNAIALAKKPCFDHYWNTYPHTILTASGSDVGLPEGQMGNSEVGHLNIGAGRVVYQELTRITKEIAEGDFFTNSALLKVLQYCKKHRKKLHICGLLSDGGVHSHIEHLLALINLCAQQKLDNVYVHAFSDGRDVSVTSAKAYLMQLQERMNQKRCGAIATVQGRYYAMDRDRRWDRTEKAYRAMVYGEGCTANSALQAVGQAYNDKIYDEFIEPTVIVDDDNKPITTVQDGDAVIYFNFRPDRAIQLSMAFNNTEFSGFDRGEGAPKDCYFVSFTRYSNEVKGEVVFSSQHLQKTIGEVVSEEGCRQLRIAETEKYPHVTYFFNGGREVPFCGEDRILIHSPKVSTYDLKPEMSAYEVTDTLLQEIENEKYDMIILNFANPDMVGHSGKLEPTIHAVEVVDKCLGKIVDLVQKKGGCAIITADHGNADQVLDKHNQPLTSHTTYPVPCIITERGLVLRPKGILADLAPTMLQLMEIDAPQEMTGESLII